jgi:hypothetical protein
MLIEDDITPVISLYEGEAKPSSEKVYVLLSREVQSR